MGRMREAHPLVSRAEALRLTSSAIEALADEVPSDERKVDELLQECVDGYFARAFTAIALAALHKGIRVDARHLVAGARLLPHPGFIARVSARVEGDVVGALVGAVTDGRLSWEKEAVSLYLAAYWSRERELTEHRQEIVRRTRMLVRSAYGREVQAFIAATSKILQDDELSPLIARTPAGAMLPLVDAWTEPFLEYVRRPLFWVLEEEDDAEPTPTTRRRAVDRIGRNEPCRCGSGKKYKRCCLAKDRERLQDSSEIAGVTRAEIRQNLEEYLTFERVTSLRAHELARLDPTRIAPELHRNVVNQLTRFEEFDALHDFFSAVGVEALESDFVDAVDAAVRAEKIDKAKALLELAPLPDEAWLGPAMRLLREGIEESPALDLLEAEATRTVDLGLIDFACDLLRSPWPHLGILVARGIAPLANPFDRDALLEELGKARDRLDLPSFEPTEGMQDLWGWGEESELYEDIPEPAEPAGRAKPAPARDDVTPRMLEEKESELARLRQELADLHDKLEEMTKATEPDVSAAHTEEPVPPEDPRVATLRDRVKHLRGELSERHAERNQLRRQLERTLKRVDVLEAERSEVEKPPEPSADQDTDADSLGFDAPVTLSYRIPVFSARFRSSAEAASDPIRRRAVVLTSRIAAGDENAFRGTKRLKAARDLYRQRVGREHRLIFRLHDGELEAVDLVPRKHLERAIRELT